MPRCWVFATTSASPSRWKSLSAPSSGSWVCERGAVSTTTTPERPPPAGLAVSMISSRHDMPESAQEAGKADQRQTRDRRVVLGLDALEQHDSPLLELVAACAFDRPIVLHVALDLTTCQPAHAQSGEVGMAE